MNYFAASGLATLKGELSVHRSWGWRSSWGQVGGPGERLRQAKERRHQQSFLLCWEWLPVYRQHLNPKYAVHTHQVQSTSSYQLASSLEMSPSTCDWTRLSLTQPPAGIRGNKRIKTTWIGSWPPGSFHLNPFHIPPSKIVIIHPSSTGSSEFSGRLPRGAFSLSSAV